MTPFDRYEAGRRTAEWLSWVFVAIALGWHVALGVIYPAGLTYWIRHDPSFGFFLPCAGFFLVRISGYLIVELRWAWDSFPEVVRARKRTSVRLLIGTTVVLASLILFNVPSDLTRPSVLPDYMYTDAQVRTKADEMRRKAQALEAGADLWPGIALSDSINSKQPCASLYDRYPPASIAGKAKEEWTTPDKVVEEAKQVFLEACEFGREYRLSTVGQIGTSPFSWMPAVNGVLNALVFLPIALCVGAFAVTATLRTDMNERQRKRTALRVIALVIIGMIWLPIRLYSETYINFFAPQPFSYGGAGYGVYAAVIVTVVAVAALVLLWLFIDSGREWAVNLWMGLITAVSTLLVAYEPARYGAVHALSTIEWPLFGICILTAALLGYALIRSFANALQKVGWDGEVTPAPTSATKLKKGAV